MDISNTVMPMFELQTMEKEQEDVVSHMTQKPTEKWNTTYQ